MVIFYRLGRFSACFIFLILSNEIHAQLNKIKAGFLAIPTFQSGFATANIGYEHFNKSGTSSWQINYNFSTGSVAADAGATKRKWVTLDKTFYNKKKSKFLFLYSFFMEIGNRTKLPGYISNTLDSVFKKTTAFEVSPGAALGFHYAFSSHWGLEAISGPKLIIDTKKESLYFNSITHQYYSFPLKKELQPGLRVMLALCYQF
jgi:hypothetical protein